MDLLEQNFSHIKELFILFILTRKAVFNNQNSGHFKISQILMKMTVSTLIKLIKKQGIITFIMLHNSLWILSSI